MSAVAVLEMEIEWAMLKDSNKRCFESVIFREIPQLAESLEADYDTAKA